MDVKSNGIAIEPLSVYYSLRSSIVPFNAEASYTFTFLSFVSVSPSTR